MMRKIVFGSTAAAVALAAFAVFAAESATGQIKAFDLKAHTLTLADGTVYMLPADFKDPGLKVGEKVTVAWVMKDNMHDATAVTIVK